LFSLTASSSEEALDGLIIEHEQEMQKMDVDSEEYAQALNKLERLHKLKEKTSPKRVDPNTVLIAASNLLGIVIIVAYEHKHVITSKALGFAGKLR